MMCFSAKAHAPHQWRCADGMTDCPGKVTLPVGSTITVADLKEKTARGKE